MQIGRGQSQIQMGPAKNQIWPAGHGLDSRELAGEKESILYLLVFYMLLVTYLHSPPSPPPSPPLLGHFQFSTAASIHTVILTNGIDNSYSISLHIIYFTGIWKFIDENTLFIFINLFSCSAVSFFENAWLSSIILVSKYLYI